MQTHQPSFTVGIEEEYLLVDRETRELVSEPPTSIMQECAAVCGDQVSPEFYRSQLEVGTRVCHTAGEARSHLADLRQSVSSVVAQHGMAWQSLPLLRILSRHGWSKNTRLPSVIWCWRMICKAPCGVWW